MGVDLGEWMRLIGYVLTLILLGWCFHRVLTAIFSRVEDECKDRYGQRGIYRSVKLICTEAW